MQTQYWQRILIGLGLAMALAVPCPSAPTNYYVVTSSQQPSPPASLWTNWGLAHTNLFEVVAVARDGDTVYVTNNAKYYLTNQIVVAYAFTLRSWGPGGIQDPSNTIIDANIPGAATTNRHFTLSNYWATLAGFTLTNGSDRSYTTNAASGGSICLQYGIVTNCIIMRNYALNPHSDYSRAGGGGICMGVNSAQYPDIGSGGVWNCTISGNSAYKNGGGILIYSKGPWRIANCTISGNSASGAQNAGGGIYANSSAAGTIISNCWVVSNYSLQYAGGMFLGYSAQCHNSFIMGNTAAAHQGGGVRMNTSTMLRNCLIANNIANGTGNAWGGGISASGANPSIQNCTVVSNYCKQDGGGIDFSNYDGFPKVENTIIWGNSASANSGVKSNYYIDRSNATYAVVTFTNCCTSPNIVSTNGVATEVNTITNDPRFVQAVTGNYRLQSGSPCINAGTNEPWMIGAQDLDGYRRIDQFSGQVDIGAYEYLPSGTLFVVH
ncbi:MAG: right-handed parallel beta-helix repeat-containing protein [Kiritimatiellaeota bacterium]|nr:right-handed parallel beta-helix repeat-containing protein [Kiritimatiellota bacterium]